jgi:hypothetical protein
MTDEKFLEANRIETIYCYNEGRYIRRPPQVCHLTPSDRAFIEKSCREFDERMAELSRS